MFLHTTYLKERDGRFQVTAQRRQQSNDFSDDLVNILKTDVAMRTALSGTLQEIITWKKS